MSDIQTGHDNVGSSSGMIVLTCILVLVSAAFIGWQVLSKQSAAISMKSIAMASGATAVAAASEKSKTAVVITGPMSTGKTALWCHLRFSATSAKRAVPRTQMSMGINAADAFIDETQAYLVDVPGHQKYRYDRDTQLQAARAVVFVIDSAAVSQDIRPTAETLYDVLANKNMQASECPVLVLCNKQDDPMALSNARIKGLLEDEIDSLRTSRQAGLDSLRGDTLGAPGAGAHENDDAAVEEKTQDFLGFDGKRFCFEDLSQPIQFNESSMVLGHDAGGLELVERWIADALH